MQNTRSCTPYQCIFSLLLITLASPVSILAQATPPATSTPSAAQSVTASPEYKNIYDEAAVALQKKDYSTALTKLDELDKAFPNTINSVNLRGAVYTDQRDFAKAAEAFARAVELDKKAFAPRFNIGEVLFLQKKYTDARAKFEVLAAEDPKNDLVRYKIFLCYLASGDKTQAEKMLNQFDFAGDLPAYYFAHAAWEFAKTPANTEEAQSWLKSAGNIYPQRDNLLFVDSLVELGYLKREEKKP